jgi:hypothetical protein
MIYLLSYGNSNSPKEYSFTDNMLNLSCIPTEYALYQNYTNPFNPTTTLRYGLPFESEVKIEMYDITGQRVTSLMNESQKAGYYELSFKIDGLSSGIYFYVIDAKEIGGTGNFRKVKKMILMK